MEPTKTAFVRGCLLVFSAGILWGTVGLFIKELERAGSVPELTGFLRVFFAFVIMGAACCVKYGAGALRVDRRTLIICVLLGLICHGIYNIFYSMAVTLAGVSISAVLLNIAPVFTLLFSALLFGERFTGIKLAAIALNIIGCALTATNGQLDIRILSITGILCGVASGACYALTAIFGRLAAGKTNPIVMSTYSYLFAAIFLALWTRPWRGIISFNTEILVWGFLYALVPTAMAYGFYYQGLRSIPESSKVPVISSVEAVVAAVIGVLLYHENLNIAGLGGMILVLISIAVMNIVPHDQQSGAKSEIL